MNMRGQSTGAGFGAIKVATSRDGGHGIDFWVDDIVRQVVHVSDNSPPGIREQAQAYRETIRVVLAEGIRNAISSDHTTIVHQLRKAGLEDAALLVMTLRR